MINFKLVHLYCCENPILIENYDKALNDETQTWEIHHKKEIDENKSLQQLINEGLYYNRPACELMFLTHSEHSKIHIMERKGEKHPMYGKRRSEKTKKLQSELKKGEKNPMYGRTGEKHPMYGKKVNIKNIMGEEAYNIMCKNRSESMKGENHPNYGKTGKGTPCFGRCWMNNGIETIYPKREDVNLYIELGYHFGRN